MNKILHAGIDGLDKRLLNYYSHPFWEKIRDGGLVGDIGKPPKIESGEIATASSPRLWARIYTGTGAETNGVLGFWEKKDENGEKHKADVDLEWLRENRCEKLVNYNTLLVPPVWETLLEEGVTVGLTTPWFSYPLTENIKDLLSMATVNWEVNGWMLTDFPFPMDSDRMEPDKYVYPEEVHPGKDFKEEVGAGARVSILKQNQPVQFFKDLKQQDIDRYEYTKERLKAGVPNLTQTLTRSVDGMQHQFGKQEDCGHLENEGLASGEENLKQIYDIQMDHVQELWEEYEFTDLIINSDHGTSVNMQNDEIKNFEGDDHAWPATFVWYGENAPEFNGAKLNYEDIVPTILHILDVDKPDFVEGYSVHSQGNVDKRLKDLGYLG